MDYLIKEAIAKVIAHGQFILGPEVFELEEKLAQYVGVKHCISVSSGTTAIHLSLMALGIGASDEVITVPYTFIGTADAIVAAGAKPIFTDVDPHTLLMDPNQIERIITHKTKAIIPVSLFGQMPDFHAIHQIADRYHIAVIEDAAQSFGATQHGKKSGSCSLLATTSFYPTKPFSCYGDGGAIFTDHDELATKLRALRNHGQIEKNHHAYMGVNGRFDTIQAAVLLVKLSYFEEEIRRRQKLAQYYQERFSHYRMLKKLDHNTHVYAQFAIFSDSRDELQEQLRQQGMQTAIYYPRCLHQQPAFSYLGYQNGDFPCAEEASLKILCLPMHHA